jgi:hypothetical protein
LRVAALLFPVIALDSALAFVIAEAWTIHLLVEELTHRALTAFLGIEEARLVDLREEVIREASQSMSMMRLHACLAWRSAVGFLSSSALARSLIVCARSVVGRFGQSIQGTAAHCFSPHFL